MKIVDDRAQQCPETTERCDFTSSQLDPVEYPGEIYIEDESEMECTWDDEVEIECSWDVVSVFEAKEEWDILSDVQTVHIFDTFQFSYKDAILRDDGGSSTGSLSLVTKRAMQSHAEPRKQGNNRADAFPKTEESDDFGSYFVRHGI